MRIGNSRTVRWLTLAALVLFSVAVESAQGDALYVGQWDGSQGWISQFTTSGTAVDLTFASPRPSDIGQSGLTVSGSSLFAVDYYAGHVGEFALSGGTTNDPLITGLSSPSGIASSMDRLFVLNSGTGTVAEYNTAGQLVNGSLITGLASPWAIAVSGDDLYVASVATNSVSKYTTSGTLVNSSLVTGLNGPQGIAVSGDRLFISNSTSGTIGEYTTSGATVNASLITGLSGPGNMVVSGDDLYVVNYGPGVPNFTGGSVGHYTTSGTAVNASLITGIYLPGGLAVVDGIPIPADLAGSDDDAYFTGTRPDPGSGPPHTINYESLEIATGSSYSLGSNETLELDNGVGTLTIQPGAVFNGNGLIDGNVLNAGLVRIPITGIGNVSSVSGGTVQLVMPAPPAPGVPVVVDPPTFEPTVVNADTLVTFSPADIGGGPGGGGGGGGSGITGQSVVWTGPGMEVNGTLGLDASLEVTGSYTQTETGALRLFIAGDVHEPGNELYSVLTVGEGVTLAGSLQIVLQPELFDYLPSLGDTFDVIRSPAGITLDPGLALLSLVTQDGSPYLAGLGVNLYPFDSGFSNDPDHLSLLSPGLWQMSLVENDTILRIEFIGVPEPATSVLLALGGVAVVIQQFRARRRAAGRFDCQAPLAGPRP